MIYYFLDKTFKNILLTNLNLAFIDELNKLANDFNNLFKDADSNIKKMLLKKKIKTRHKKITFIDALCYIFNYSFIHPSKQTVVSDYNYDNNLEVDRTSYYKKELKIPLKFYNNIFIKIKSLLDKYLNKNNNLFNVIAVDGTYSNTNIYNDKTLETCLNMGYYDATNHIAIDLELKGVEDKNKEIKAFVDYIKKNNFDIDNLILVFDRAYFSYDFINTLTEHNLNYVIRIRNNSIGIRDKNKIINKLTNDNVRFIDYKSDIIITKKDKDNNDVKLKETIECNVVTNLPLDKYDNDLIKKIYMMRWSVEVFFKLIKSNFKFAYLKEHNSNTIEQYKKKYLIILINLYIIRLIEHVYDKYNKNKKTKYNSNNKNKHIYNIKYNNTLMIEGLEKIINPIIKGKINNNDLNKYCNSYIKLTNTIKDTSNPRVSKIPFSKWYVKSYSCYYQYKKIIEAIKNNDLQSLNKNLKVLANKIKIIEQELEQELKQKQ